MTDVVLLDLRHELARTKNENRKAVTKRRQEQSLKPFQAELIRLQKAGQPMEKYAALTFDDGYADFLQLARPSLTAALSPCTVFIATGFTGSAFWWEEVSELMAPRQGVEAPLVVDFGGGDRQTFTDLDGADGATSATRAICYRMKAGDQEQIRAVLEQIRVERDFRGGVDLERSA